MLSQTDLILLQKGDLINHFLLLKKCEIKLTKSNKQYLYLELADRTLSLSANIWENFSKIYSELKTGDIVKVTGSMDDYLGIPQIKIISIKESRSQRIIFPLLIFLQDQREMLRR